MARGRYAQKVVRGAALLTVAVLVAACGGDDGDTSSSSTAAPASTAEVGATTATSAQGTTEVADGTMPVTVTDATGAEITISSTERIIPLDGDIAEIVFALGLGDHVVATDLSATYPPEADALPQIGYQRALSAEPIAAFSPTVLLATDLAGPPETLDALRTLSMPVVIIPDPADPSGPATKIRATGAALGIPHAAEELASRTQSGIDDAIADGQAAVKADGRPRVMALYLRGSSVQLVFGEGSGIDWVIDAAGGLDVGTELGIKDYGPITAESVIKAAPDVFLVTTTGLDSVGGVDGLLAIPGLDQTPAGQNRAVHSFDDQFLLGGGPRTPQLIRELFAALHPDAASSASTSS